ncbi:type I polyketide synthase [Nocardia sp. NPDC049526]|uniref:type I polyketide synthase n=1 Tax=Nocardia sp. NPDC049526 TaxID=3364316 RepID=UPI0037AEE95B
MTDPIAIVGIGCRFPGATGPNEYWRLLLDGVDAISEVPRDRWPVEDFYDDQPRTPGRMNTRWGGFLSDIDSFDAGFFGISQREAERMDPQQRLALEVSYEALADAGIPMASLAERSVGIYVGASTYDHGAALQASGGAPGIYDGTGSALSIIANRISYCLDLRGPSLTVDTACSSSLVAIHLAAQAIQRGEVDIAVAGGVNVITSPGIAIIFSQGGLMAPDGRCKAFDHRADGYVRGEGAGFVVLKPLSRALADRDRIYATVLGGATNHDGKTNGLTAPSRIAQQALLTAAYRDAGISPAVVDYVEAHGTGTAVGDPIEVGALATVLGPGRDRVLRIGSGKTNIGHLEAAAGVAGLIKTALALHHRTLPPIVHFQQPNPLLGLERIPVTVQTDLEPWPTAGDIPLAAVSSFGFGGTNAHIVMSGTAPRARVDTRPAELPVLVPISVVSAQQLRETAVDWQEFAQRLDEDPAELAATAAAAAVRGDHHRHRLAVIAADTGELSSAMAALGRGESTPQLVGPRDRPGRTPRVAFVFPGQGPQWLGMGRRLAAAVPEFRAALAECDAVIAELIGTSLWADADGLVADGTEHIQPALFAVQVALARTWQAWGIRPAAVIGHSMGEIAAAHIAGALSLEQAARVVCARSELAAEISGRGALALVELGAEEAAELTRGRTDVLSVAALNGPRATVMSGTVGAIEELVTELERRRVFVRRIAVAFAAHSPEVEPLQPRLAAALTGLRPEHSEIPFYSTVFGEPVSGAELGADYWVRNLRAPVRFFPAADRLLADGHRVLIEISPHPVLGHALTDIVAAGGHQASVLASMRRDEDELAGLLRGVATAYTAGVPVDWHARHPGPVPHRTLPRPVWAHRRYPAIRAVDALDSAMRPGRSGALLGPSIPIGVDPSMQLWPLTFDRTARPELAEHQVEEQSVVPGAYWLAAAQTAAAPAGPVVLRQVEFTAPYCPAERGGDVLQLSVRKHPDGERRFDIVSVPTNRAAIRHASGIIGTATESAAVMSQGFDLDAIRRHCVDPMPVTTLYDGLAAVGLRYGPAFRALTEVWTGPNAALGRFARPDGLGADARPLHPALLDSCLHTIAAAARHDSAGSLPLPVGVELITVTAPEATVSAGWCHAEVRAVTGRELIADVTITDESGVIRWQATGFTVRYANPVRGPEHGRLYGVRWEPRDARQTASAPGPWVVLGDHAAVSRVAPRLTAPGIRTLAVIDLDLDTAARSDRRVPAPQLDDSAVTTIVRRLATAADYAELLAEATAEIGVPQGIIDLRATVAGPKAPALDNLRDAASRALQLTRAVADLPATPALWFATADTQQPSLDAYASTLFGAVLWGLGRSVALELPKLIFGLVDLETTGGTDCWSVADRDIAALGELIRGGDAVDQAIVRDGTVFEPVLSRLTGAAAHRRPSVRADRTYLITGGFGVLGRHVARWLISHGARHVVLASRTGPTPSTDSLRAELAAPGVDVRAAALEVSDADQVHALIAAIQATEYPLAGVFHAAGVLADALLPSVGTAELTAALDGKAMGAWHLHHATRDLPIEHFVLFSSLAGLTGSPGQAAYAASNTFLDALAEHRAAAGMPALSIQWGTWGGAGLAVQAGGVERIAGRGLPPLAPEAGLELLESALGAGAPTVVAAAFDPEPLRRTLTVLPPPLRTLLAPVAGTVDTGQPVARGAARAAVLALDSRTAQCAELERILLGLVAEVLGTQPDQIDPQLPFQESGLDSLTAIELRDRLQTGFDMELSAALFFAHPTVEAFAAELQIRLCEPSSVAAEPNTESDNTSLIDDTELSELADDELTELLAAEIQALREMGDK